MDPPSLDTKPISALPSHLLNNDVRMHNGRSPLRTSVGAKEREKLTASIVSSSGRKPAIDLDSLHKSNVNGYDLPKMQEQYFENSSSAVDLDVAARDPRDRPAVRTTPHPSRPASPYTLNPPIDFDGLSWPSEFGLDLLSKSYD